MKKKIIIAISLILPIFMVGISIYHTNGKSAEMSSLILANVAALTQNESKTYYTVHHSKYISNGIVTNKCTAMCYVNPLANSGPTICHSHSATTCCTYK